MEANQISNAVDEHYQAVTSLVKNCNDARIIKDYKDLLERLKRNLKKVSEATDASKSKSLKRQIRTCVGSIRQKVTMAENIESDEVIEGLKDDSKHFKELVTKIASVSKKALLVAIEVLDKAPIASSHAHGIKNAARITANFLSLIGD